MDITSAARTFEKVLHAWSGNWAFFRVIIAHDYDVEIRINDSPVRLWSDPERKGESITTLRKGQTYHFPIVEWPRLNSKGEYMVCVLWTRDVVGWMNSKFATPINHNHLKGDLVEKAKKEEKK